jgi:hypothetical protein
METFEYKPALEKYAGQVLGGDVRVHDGRRVRSCPAFSNSSSMDKAESMFRDLSEHRHESRRDCISALGVGRSDDHVQATYEMQSGQLRMGYPSMGSWITYGLGSENANLPGFIVLQDARGGPLGASNNWMSGFLPSTFKALHSWSATIRLSI